MNAPVPKNPPPLPPGMDNPWYDFSPYPSRPKLAWPRNARVAFCVLLHLEYWELMPAENSHRDPRYVGEFGNYRPDYRTWTQREYGNRVGIFRVLGRRTDELLLGEDDRHLDFRVSVLLRDDGEAQWATVTTVVRFHNALGRAYFAVVRPFHQLIVPALIRRALRVAAAPRSA